MGATVPFNEPLDEGRDLTYIIGRVTFVPIKLEGITYTVVPNGECANFIVDAHAIRFPHSSVQH